MNEERLTELCLFNLEKKRLKRESNCSTRVAHVQLKGGYREDKVSLFSEGYSKRMRGKWMRGHNLQQGKIQLNIKKKVFTRKAVKHWNSV